MATINGKSYSSPKNINLKGGILRFDALHSSNPLGDVSYGLYVNSSGDLIYRNLTTSVTLGAAGSGGGAAPSLDAIYAGDQTLAITATTLTLAGSTATADILTITNASGKTGDCIQITNSGTGSDIKGTSSTWSFSKAGVNVMKSTTIAGTAGSDSITLTAGDIVASDSSITLTDADNAASLTITNDTATSESVIVLAGSGAFAGTTTKSFMTITPSGLTTGGAVYLPLAAITEGKGLYVLSGTTLTSGALVVIESGAGTGITNTTGALLEIKSGDTAGTNAVIVGMSTAATDETILLKLTASDALALGNILNITASAMTTGSAIVVADLAALTTGQGIKVSSAATAITTTGRLFVSDHTGNAGTSATLNEFKTAAADETILVKLTAEAMITGTVLSLGALAALTTGTGIGIAHTTSVIANGGSLVKLSSSSVDTATTSGSILDITNTGSVAGTIVRIYSNLAAQTATMLLEAKAAGYTTGFTGDVVKFTGCSTTGAGNVLSISSANTTAGTGLLVTSAATTTNGRAVKVVAEGLTTGVGIGFAHTTSVIADTGSMVRLSDSGVATGGATNGFILDIASTGSTAGTLVKILSNVAGQTDTCALDISSAGYTTGYTGSVVKITGASTTGASNVLLVTSANTTAGNAVKIDAAAITTGTGLLVTTAGVVITTGELVSLIADAATTSTGVLRLSATGLTNGWAAQFTGGGANFSATGGVLNLAMGAATAGTGILITTTGIYTGTTGLIDINAVETTTGTIIDIVNTGRTTGDVIKISTNTSGTGNYIHCWDGAATDFKVSRYGATTIAGNAAGTAALTVSAGDLKVDGGSVIFASKIIFSGIETIAAGGTTTALDLSKSLHSVDADAGGDIFTLADGIIGQITTIACKSATGVCTITPANLAGGTSVTLNAEGDCVILQFVDTQWYIMGGNGYSVI